MPQLIENKNSLRMRKLRTMRLSRRFQYLPRSGKTKWMVVDCLDIVYACGEAPTKTDAIKQAKEFLVQRSTSNATVDSR